MKKFKTSKTRKTPLLTKKPVSFRLTSVEQEGTVVL